MSDKIVGYARASTTDQEDTIKAQVERIEAYAKLRGLEIAEIYIDFGVSGTVALEQRENGAKMLDTVMARTKFRPTGIVAVRLDRMFRNAADCLKNVEAWEKHGVALHLVDMGGQSVDTSTTVGKFLITIMAGVAEMERNLIAERTSIVLQSKKRRGEVYGRTPIGYDREGDKLVKNDGEQTLIERIRTMRAKGLAYNKIAAVLNAEGIRGKNGGRFGSETIAKILSA